MAGGGKKKSGGNGGDGGYRGLHVRVKSARGRTKSSVRWLSRQLNDPYVQRAKKDGYRGRAAYKLVELDEKFKFLAPGQCVVDLGAAPGGWTQVAVRRCGENNVVGIDLKEIEPIAGAHLFVQDFTEDDAPDNIKAALGGRGVDVVVSDMAPNTTGQAEIDHLRIMLLCELAAHFAFEVLNKGGTFVAKVRQGGTEVQLLNELKKQFSTVKHAKPGASRKDSAESYVVAMGFRGKE